MKAPLLQPTQLSSKTTWTTGIISPIVLKLQMSSGSSSLADCHALRVTGKDWSRRGPEGNSLQAPADSVEVRGYSVARSATGCAGTYIRGLPPTARALGGF